VVSLKGVRLRVRSNHGKQTTALAAYETQRVVQIRVIDESTRRPAGVSPIDPRDVEPVSCALRDGVRKLV
jgi:hypothetical protein